MAPIPAQSRILAEVDATKANDFWMGRVSPITKEHLINGTGPIEHLTKSSLTGDEEEDINEGLRMKFGKYKGKSYAWVEENDEYYWGWLKGNVKGFENL